MAPTITNRIGAFAGTIGLLLITLAIGWLAWMARQQYLDQQQYDLVSTQGQLVTVKLEAVDRSSRNWKDQLTNAVYLQFAYQQKPYTLRYKQDSSWLTAGHRIELYYHAGLDAFRQPRLHSFFKTQPHQSRLIGFTITGQWTDTRKWLVLWVGLTTVFTLLAAGLLATITGIALFRTLGRLLFTGMLLTGVAYLTYNTIQYHRYYNRLRTGAREETVQVLGTNRRAISRRSNWFYTHEAMVQQGKQEKLIPIDETDYNTLRPGAPLQVYYNRQLDDMMSVNYTPAYINLAATGFAWLLLIVFAGGTVKKMRRQKAQRP